MLVFVPPAATMYGAPFSYNAVQNGVALNGNFGLVGGDIKIDLNFNPNIPPTELEVKFVNPEIIPADLMVFVSSNRIHINMTTDSTGRIVIGPAAGFLPNEPIAISVYMSTVFEPKLTPMLFPTANTMITIDLLKIIENSTPVPSKVEFFLVDTPCVDAQINIFKAGPGMTAANQQSVFNGQTQNCMLTFDLATFLFYNAAFSYTVVQDVNVVNGQFVFFGGYMRIDVSFVPPTGPQITLKLTNPVQLPAFVPVTVFQATRRINLTSNGSGMVVIGQNLGLAPGDAIAITVFENPVFEKAMLTTVFPAESIFQDLELKLLN